MYAYNKGYSFNIIVLNLLAIYGNLELLIFFIGKGFIPNVETMNSSVEGAKLECLKYLHRINCPWNMKTCENAVSSHNKDITILKYLHENGCPWDSKTFEKSVQNKNIEFLKYCHINKCPYNKEISVTCVIVGNDKALRFLHENGYTFDKRVCEKAAASLSLKGLDCLKYLHENGYILKEFSYSEIYHLEILEYILKNILINLNIEKQIELFMGFINLPRINNDIYLEMKYSWSEPIDFIKYLISKNFPLSEDLCIKAIESNNLEILTCLHENECPWNIMVCNSAIRNDRIEILKYLHENGCPWDGFTFYCAVESNNLEIIKYLCDNKCPYDEQYTYQIDILHKRGRLTMEMYYYISNYFNKQNKTY